MSDIGAIEPGLWQLTQERCRIGATSSVNVTSSAAAAGAAASINAAAGRVSARAARLVRRIQVIVNPPVSLSRSRPDRRPDQSIAKQ